MHKTFREGITCCEAPTCTVILAEGQNFQHTPPPRYTSSCTEFQIPYPKPFSIVMDVSTTPSEFTVPSAHDTRSETSGISSQPQIAASLGVPNSRPWPLPPPPKPELGNQFGCARHHSPPAVSQYVERRRNEAAPVVQEGTPVHSAAAGEASGVMPPRPLSQSPPWMGTVGPQQHFLQKSAGDLAGRTRQLVAHHRHFIHENWEVIQPNLAATAAPRSRIEV